MATSNPESEKQDVKRKDVSITPEPVAAAAGVQGQEPEKEEDK